MLRAEQTTKQGSEQAIRAVTAQIFSESGLPPEIANTYGFSERVVQAELGYRHHAHIPVRDSDIATSINNLSASLGAPIWTKTNLAEVRRLRMLLIFRAPHFMASEAPPDEKGHYRALDDDISPLQATYIAALLVQQKLLNPNFQFTEEEKKQAIFKDKTSKAKESRSRSLALRDSIVNSSQHSLRDLLHTADGFLSDLHIAPIAEKQEVSK